MKDRNTGRVSAEVVEYTDKPTLQGFVRERTEQHALLDTDEHPSHARLPRRHMAVRHSAKEFMNRVAHTNCIEPICARLKGGCNGAYHHFSSKHLQRRLNEFVARYNLRPLDIEDQMTALAQGMNGKRLSYSNLVGERHTPTATAVTFCLRMFVHNHQET